MQILLMGSTTPVEKKKNKKKKKKKKKTMVQISGNIFFDHLIYAYAAVKLN